VLAAGEHPIGQMRIDGSDERDGLGEDEVSVSLVVVESSSPRTAPPVEIEQTGDESLLGVL